MKMRNLSVFFSIMIISLTVNSCYFMQSSQGGGQTSWQPPRRTSTEDIALPKGYKIEVAAQNLTFPTNVAFDDEGNLYVVEAGYSYGEVFSTPRLLRIDNPNKYTEIASGSKNGPWTSVTYHKGYFYISEGGELEGGRILKISPKGIMTVIADSLPSFGDHHTNAVLIGDDGYIYFGQGTATNSGIVGPDDAKFGWLYRKPDFHDIPCRDIVLTGINFESENPLIKDGAKVETGAFSPFGTKTYKNQIVKGELPCSGSIMRLPIEGGKLELVAWGFRNPFGLAFAPDGKLYATDNGYDDRGSRPLWGTGDVLWKIENGQWYGWPDYAEGHGLRDLKPLLATKPNELKTPAAILGVHSSSDGFDFSRSGDFGYFGEAFIAQFGDQAPIVGKTLAPVGFKVVRVNVNNGVINDFVVNKGSENGPASRLGTEGLERPVAVKFSPDGKSLYIIDFGVMLMTRKGPAPQQNTGVIWKVSINR